MSTSSVESKFQIRNTVEIRRALPNIKLGDRVHIRSMMHPKYPNKPREGFGTVIAIIGAGMELTEKEAVEIHGNGIYEAKFTSGKPIPLQNFMRAKAVDRIVVKRDDPKDQFKDGYFVQPNVKAPSFFRFPLEIIT